MADEIIEQPKTEVVTTEVKTEEPKKVSLLTTIAVSKVTRDKLKGLMGENDKNLDDVIKGLINKAEAK